MMELWALAALLQSGPISPDAEAARAFNLTILLVLIGSRVLAGPLLYQAAKSRPGGREVWWGALASCLPIVAAITFFVARPRARGAVVGSWNPWVMCPWCQAPRGYSADPCPRCGQLLPPPMAWAPPQAPWGAPPGYMPPPGSYPPSNFIPLPPPAQVPSAKEAARPKVSDIGGAQVIGAILFTFVLASLALYLLLIPWLFDPTFTQDAFLALNNEPWFVTATLIVQDSILVGVALDQTLFRKRLTRSEMGLKVRGLKGGVPRNVGLGILAGAGTFALSVIALQILIDTLRITGADLGSGGSALEPRIASVTDYGFWIASGVVIAPIAEELFFRGYALGGYAARGLENSGILVSSALFAAVHLNFINFGPLFVVGLVLGALRLKTGSLVAPITAHATNNFIVMTLTLLGL